MSWISSDDETVLKRSGWCSRAIRGVGTYPEDVQTGWLQNVRTWRLRWMISQRVTCTIHAGGTSIVWKMFPCRIWRRDASGNSIFRRATCIFVEAQQSENFDTTAWKEKTSDISSDDDPVERVVVELDVFFELIKKKILHGWSSFLDL